MTYTSSAKPKAARPRSGLNSGLDVLECLAAHGEPLSMTEIAGAIGMAKSSVSQLLATLQERALVRRLTDQRYVIGMRAWEIGCRASPVGFGRLALPHMAQLSRDISEGVALGVLEFDHTVCIQLVDSPNVIRVHACIGDHTPAHCVSSGLAMLATLSDDEVKQIFPEELERLTPLTITRRSALIEELARVRERGYACMRGGWRADVGGVAVALCGADQAAVAALNVALPLTRMTQAWLDDSLPLIRQTARAIEREFGTRNESVPRAEPRYQNRRRSRETASSGRGDDA